jgi:hypothetical protein
MYSNPQEREGGGTQHPRRTLFGTPDDSNPYTDSSKTAWSRDVHFFSNNRMHTHATFRVL